MFSCGGIRKSCLLTIALLVSFLPQTARSDDSAVADNAIPHVGVRFQEANDEVPDFQKHVVPLMGRLGCNGRACHGSFQGRGGFQLSLFGYDFEADHLALFDKDSPRVDLESPEDSLILFKPTDEDEHEGGQRFERDGWEYRLFKQWVEAGAPKPENLSKLVRLDITPSEIEFAAEGEQHQLQVTAVWEDGSREDVTPLCRFKSNDDQFAQIDDQGLVTGGGAGATHVVVFYDKAVVPVSVFRPVSEQVGDNYPDVPTPTKVDELVVQRLRKLGIVPSELADDATFLRRLSLDMTGTLPTPEEVAAFLADNSPDKRAKKIDELLESPAYAAWWTTKLCDYTGNNSLQVNNSLPIQNQASQDWYDWIYKRVNENTPYDQLVSGIVTAKSLEPGQNYQEFSEDMCAIYRGDGEKSFADLPSMTHYWSRRDFRDAESRAINFAYAFMGVRIQCAQCHKHPFDQWSKQDFDQFTKFFGSVVFDPSGRQMHADEYNELVQELGVDSKKRNNQLRREFAKYLEQGKTVPMPVVAVRPGARGARRQRGRKPEPQPQSVKLLGGEDVPLKGVKDVREPLMEWLKREDNPYFAKAFVNRVWASYFGIGIIEPADDLNLANPPSNEALLKHLERGFVENGYDMKWLHREIANSRTYQLDWRTNETNEMDQIHFSHAFLRRMPAEVVCDAILQATAGSKDMGSFRDNLEQRTIAISGTQPVPALRSRLYALQVFGRSTRESNCDCDRSEEVSLLQTVYLQNDQDMMQVLKRRGGWLNEVAGVSAPAGAGRNQDARRIQQVRQRLAQIEKQLVRAKEKGNEKLIKTLQTQRTALRTRLKQAAPKQEVPQDDVAGTDDKANQDYEKLVTEAYLRTLSRFPDANERARCLAYFEESGSLAKGMEGVLWALINTKEFRVVH